MHTTEIGAVASGSHTPARRGLNSNDAAAQRARLLEALRHGPKHTIQLRSDSDILSPAPRILELRRRGFDILTQWVHQPTDCGKVHRVAQYVLVHETGGQP
jgi:hypothetical protein